MEIERRMVQANDLRVVAEGPPRIVGHAALFDRLSDDLGGFRERIRPGAFAASLVADDVRALFYYDPNVILGRNRAGTLRLTEDERGLGIEIDPPEHQAARDLVGGMTRAEIVSAVEQIVAAVADEYGLVEAKDAVTLRSSLHDDLGMDEVDLIEVVFREEQALRFFAGR